MSNWRPIDDCPKTESYGPFLVFMPIAKRWDDPRNVHKVWWDAATESIMGWDSDRDRYPIYWQPMPSAPKRN